MTGAVCPLCGGEMHEDMYSGDSTCDCCDLIVKYDGMEDYSLFNGLLEGNA